MSLLLIALAPLALAESAAPTLEERPRAIAMDSSIGGPLGLVGLRAGYAIKPRLELELAGGAGLLGYKASPGLRLHRPKDERKSWWLSAAPVYSFRFDQGDVHLEDEGELRWALYTDLGGGWEYRGQKGFLFRWGLHLAVHIADNQEGLCDGVPQGRDQPYNSCNPPHNRPAAEIASTPLWPGFSYSFGWAF
jgi:hypothetical protein